MVAVRLTIRADGKVEDAVPISGPRMLWAAVVPAARQPPPVFNATRARVIVIGQGRRVIANDVPREEVRAVRCLWLWHCGLRPLGSRFRSWRHTSQPTAPSATCSRRVAVPRLWQSDRMGLLE